MEGYYDVEAARADTKALREKEDAENWEAVKDTEFFHSLLTKIEEVAKQGRNQVVFLKHDDQEYYDNKYEAHEIITKEDKKFSKDEKLAFKVLGKSLGYAVTFKTVQIIVCLGKVYENPIYVDQYTVNW
jgi:hypothetical protein